MQRINKIIFLFLAMIVVLWAVFWKVIHSNKFALIVSSNIQKAIETKFDAHVEFSNFEFEVLPPGVSLKEVRIIKKDANDKEKLNILTDKMSVFFNIIDLFENKVSIKSIGVTDGVVKLPIRILSDKEVLKVLSNQDKSKSNQRINFEKIRSILDKKLPIRVSSFNFTDVSFEFSDFSFEVAKLIIKNKDKFFSVQTKLNSIPKIKIKEYLLEQVDGVDLSIDWDKDGIQVNHLNLYQGINELSLSGKIKSLKGSFEDGELDLYAKTQIPYESLKKVKFLDEIVDFEHGLIGVGVALKGSIKSPVVKYEIEGNKLRTSMFNSTKLYLRGMLKQNFSVLSLEKFELKNKNEHVSLDEEVDLFNIKNQKVILSKIKLSINELKVTNALKYIGDILNPLKGELTGGVEVFFDENQVRFQPQHGFSLTKARLNYDGEQNIINHDDKINLDKMLFLFNFKKIFFEMKGRAYSNTSNIFADGHAGNDKIRFSVSPQSQIDLASFKIIEGLGIKGNGQLGFTIKEKEKQVLMEINTNLKDVEIAQYKLGNSVIDMEINLSKGYLDLRRVDGVYKRSNYFINGLVDYESEKLVLEGDFSKAHYDDLKVIYGPLFSNIEKSMPLDMAGNLAHDFRLDSNFNFSNLNVIGNLKSSNLYLYGESFKNVKSKFSYENDIFDFSDILIKKNRGNISGHVSWNTITEETNSKLYIQDLDLGAFNIYKSSTFGLEGKLNGHLALKGKITKPELNSSLIISKSVVNDESVPNSSLSLNMKNKNVKFNFNGLGKNIRSSGNINFNGMNKPRSKLTIDVDVTRSERLMGVFFKFLKSEADISTKLVASSSIDFNINNIKNSNVFINLKKMFIRDDSGEINIGFQPYEFKIINGRPQKWDYRVKNKHLNFITKAQGELGQNFVFQTIMDLDSQIIERFLPQSMSIKGVVKNKLELKSLKDNFDYYTSLETKDLNYGHISLPAKLEKIESKLVFENEKFYIEQFDSIFGSGKLSLFGSIDLSNIIPKVKILSSFENSNLKLSEKNSLQASGNIKLEGDDFPYYLKGDVTLLSGKLHEEFSEYGGLDDQYLSKYIPNNQINIKEVPLAYNLNINALGNLAVKNSSADLSLRGGGKLKGFMNNPQFSGRFVINEQESKLLFKGHEFIINKGTIDFNDGDTSIDPYLDIQSFSEISDYDIKMRVSGKVSDPEVSFSSEPALARFDVLSLITLGFTTADTVGLDEAERQNLTSVGIGSLLFDQFKINRGLRDKLGVNLSFSSEISENENSLLDGKSNNASSQSSRYRSATSIQLRKNLSRNIEVSVSSTVGGNVGQKQRMNLNYYFNKRLSAEGIYEVRSSNDGDEDNQDTSLGLDLKYKKAF